MTQIKPLASQTTPRFADIATFFRLPIIKDLEKLDYCICGIPWDGGTTNRPGARHGPREVRNASSLIRTYLSFSLWLAFFHGLGRLIHWRSQQRIIAR